MNKLVTVVERVSTVGSPPASSAHWVDTVSLAITSSAFTTLGSITNRLNLRRPNAENTEASGSCRLKICHAKYQLNCFPRAPTHLFVAHCHETRAVCDEGLWRSLITRLTDSTVLVAEVPGGS